MKTASRVKNLFRRLAPGGGNEVVVPCGSRSEEETRIHSPETIKNFHPEIIPKLFSPSPSQKRAMDVEKISAP